MPPPPLTPKHRAMIGRQQSKSIYEAPCLSFTTYSNVVLSSMHVLSVLIKIMNKILYKYIKNIYSKRNKAVISFLLTLLSLPTYFAINFFVAFFISFLKISLIGG